MPDPIRKKEIVNIANLVNFQWKIADAYLEEKCPGFDAAYSRAMKENVSSDESYAWTEKREDERNAFLSSIDIRGKKGIVDREEFLAACNPVNHPERRKFFDKVLGETAMKNLINEVKAAPKGQILFIKDSVLYPDDKHNEWHFSATLYRKAPNARHPKLT